MDTLTEQQRPPLPPTAQMSSPALENESQTTEVCVFLMDKNGINMQLRRPSSKVTCQEILDRLNFCLHRKRQTNASEESFHCDCPSTSATTDSMRSNISLSQQNGQQFGLQRTQERLFALWMCSPLLEVQLKPQHRPFNLLCNWDELLRRFAFVKKQNNQGQIIEQDTPSLSYQRNVYIGLDLEEQVDDPLAIKLLFEEAKENVVQGRYPLETTEYYQLAALALRAEEQRSYQAEVHTQAYVAQRLENWLPPQILPHATLLDFGLQRTRIAAKVLQLFKELPAELGAIDMHLNYLRIVREKPFYGSAFFQAQIERPVSALGTLMNHYDLKIWLAINTIGLHFIDQKASKLLMSLPHGQFTWEVALPSDDQSPDRMPCVFVHVQTDSNRANLMQVFTKQALLIESLLKKFESLLDNVDSRSTHSQASVNSFLTSHSMTLKRFCCAKFNNKGECIKKKGSFNYVKNSNVKSKV